MSERDLINAQHKLIDPEIEVTSHHVANIL